MKREFFTFSKLLLVTSFCAVAVGVPQNAIAGTVSGARITKLGGAEAQAFFVYVDIAPTNVPACATETSSVRRFAVDPGTPGGKAEIAAIIAAFAAGRTIDIGGRGQFPAAFPGAQACNVWSTTETINYMFVN
jgi:hypothetical protein